MGAHSRVYRGRRMHRPVARELRSRPSEDVAAALRTAVLRVEPRIEVREQRAGAHAGVPRQGPRRAAGREVVGHRLLVGEGALGTGARRRPRARSVTAGGSGQVSPRVGERPRTRSRSGSTRQERAVTRARVTVHRAPVKSKPLRCRRLGAPVFVDRASSCDATRRDRSAQSPEGARLTASGDQALRAPAARSPREAPPRPARGCGARRRARRGRGSGPGGSDSGRRAGRRSGRSRLAARLRTEPGPQSRSVTGPPGSGTQRVAGAAVALPAAGSSRRRGPVQLGSAGSPEALLHRADSTASSANPSGMRTVEAPRRPRGWSPGAPRSRGSPPQDLLRARAAAHELARGRRGAARPPGPGSRGRSPRARSSISSQHASSPSPCPRLQAIVSASPPAGSASARRCASARSSTWM